MWDCEWLAYHDITFIAVHWLRVFHAHIDWIRSTFNQITPISFAPCALALVPTLPPPQLQIPGAAHAVYQSSKTVKTAKMTVGVPVVTSLPRLYQPCTKNSQKTVKTAKITVGVPIVTCLLRVRRIQKVCVRRIHKAYKKYWFSHLPDCIRS